MRCTRPVLWMTLLLGACGGVTVDGSSPDVAASQQPDASADVVALDAATPPPADATVDAGTGDRQLPGDLSPLQDVVPLVPPGAPYVVDLAVHEQVHQCALMSDATMRCRGLNAHGKLGNGASVWPGDVDTPVDPGLTGVRSVATGEYQTCAVRDDDSLWCWGSGEYGGLGYEATEGCAGITEPTRCATRPQRVPGIDRVRRAFLGVWGGCAQRFDHSVWCWGTLGNPRYSPMPTPIVW